MIYLLKFGASWILPPGIFIFFLFMLAVYWWRKKGERRIAALLAGITMLFYLLCTGLVAERTMGWLESRYVPPKQPAGDVIVMLGGGALPDVPDVSGEGALCAYPANRLLTVIRLQKMLDIPVLLSGGQVYKDTGNEAQIARRMLTSLGVPEDKVLIEPNSINTNENAKFSIDLMRKQGLSQPILVTSAFHMNRSVLAFSKQGMEVLPYPTDYQVGRKHELHYMKLSPQADALQMNVTVLRELLRTMVTRYLE